MDEQKRPRAWVYARIPGDYVGTMDSIKVCALQAHADGCTVVGSSTDEHGGWLLRPGYREMLRHIRKGEIDTVYICRMRHISRSEGHLISFFRQLKHGFATSIDSLNPVNPSPVFAGSTGKTGIDIIQNNIALNHLGKMVDFNFHCGLL